MFRASKTYNRGLYDVIDGLFSGSIEIPQEFANLSLDTLYFENGHSVEDMLVRCARSIKDSITAPCVVTGSNYCVSMFRTCSCTWAGRPCDVSDFTATLTDFGLCFSFNDITKDVNESIHRASQTGLHRWN